MFKQQCVWSNLLYIIISLIHSHKAGQCKILQTGGVPQEWESTGPKKESGRSTLGSLWDVDRQDGLNGHMEQHHEDQLRSVNFVNDKGYICGQGVQPDEWSDRPLQTVLSVRDEEAHVNENFDQREAPCFVYSSRKFHDNPNSGGKTKEKQDIIHHKINCIERLASGTDSPVLLLAQHPIVHVPCS